MCETLFRLLTLRSETLYKPPDNTRKRYTSSRIDQTKKERRVIDTVSCRISYDCFKSRRSGPLQPRL
jgi:hypothetical protein